MITLETADLVIIAGRVLGLDTTQVLDLLDLSAAESAVTQVRPDSDQGDSDDQVAGQAAVLLCALVRGKPLRRGNNQVALAATLQFLALNGQQLDPDPPEAVAAMVADVTAGTLGAAEVADWLAPRLLPAGQPVARVKEESMRVTERIRRATVRRQPEDIYQRFTGRARRVVYLATEQARLLGHGYVGTEHLLLGLVVEGKGLAAETLKSLGLSLEEVRRQITAITDQGQGQGTPPSHTPPPHIPLTPQAKKVLEQSLREALSLGHHYIGTEHLLLGLLRVERGIAARVLTGLGADHDRVRARVVDLLNQREQDGGTARPA